MIATKPKTIKPISIMPNIHKTKNTTKYHKEANKKARKAVADFFISTFEITPL